MKSPIHSRNSLLSRRHQSGAAAVEFALISLFAFLPLMLGIVEFGRLFYVANTVQEVTRRAARAQVVNWTSESNSVQRYAVFRNGNGALAGAPEVTNATVNLGFYHSYADAVSSSNPISGIASAQDNLTNCLLASPNCILFVRATLESGGAPIAYTPMIGWFGDLFSLPLPGATVIMPAEALGLL
jgi:Flp pilus assembly protein TadG